MCDAVSDNGAVVAGVGDVEGIVEPPAADELCNGVAAEHVEDVEPVEPLAAADVECPAAAEPPLAELCVAAAGKAAGEDVEVCTSTTRAPGKKQLVEAGGQKVAELTPHIKRRREQLLASAEKRAEKNQPKKKKARMVQDTPTKGKAAAGAAAADENEGYMNLISSLPEEARPTPPVCKKHFYILVRGLCKIQVLLKEKAFFVVTLATGQKLGKGSIRQFGFGPRCKQNASEAWAAALERVAGNTT